MTQPPQPESQPIDLREFSRILRRRNRIVILATALVALSALGLVYLRTPQYASQAEVEVQPSNGDEQPLDINMQTEATRVTQEQVAALAAPAIGLDPHSPPQLEHAVEGVSVTVPSGTTYLNISCTAVDPVRAQTCASAFANAYVDYRVTGAEESYHRALADIMLKIRLANRQLDRLQAQLDRLEAQKGDSAEERAIQQAIERQNQIIIAAQALAFGLPSPSPTAALVSRSADLPDGPANKAFALTGMLAALLGLALGIGLAFIRERLDERVGDRAGFEAALSAPVLATVPRVGTWHQTRDQRLITRDAPQSQAAEAYRAARPTLTFLAKRNSVKVVAVTGPDERDATSTVTANLAVSLAAGGASVVAVCCDLRRPRLHLFFRRSDESGLSDVLTGRLPWRDVLQGTDVDGVSIIASGPAPDNPAELLGRSEMKVLLTHLRNKFDLVLLDTAPALIVADTITLVPDTDGVLIVANASKTTRTAVTHLRHQFEQVGGHVIGGILTDVPGASRDRYSSYFRTNKSGDLRDITHTERVSKPDPGSVPVVDGRRDSTQ